MLPAKTIELWKFNAKVAVGENEEHQPEYEAARAILDLIADVETLREQRDAANAQIQMLNSIIAGDVE